MKTKKRLLSILLSLALMLGLVPGMRMTAYAAGTTWSESFTTNGGTIDGGVSVTADITLTIPDGVTLTVNGGIDASGKTLTVEGAGTLKVYGADATSAKFAGDGFKGSTLIVNGATVEVRGGEGVNTSKNGGYGVNGSVTVNSGSVKVYGGNGGTEDSLGHGRDGVLNALTVNGGTIEVYGGGAGGTGKNGGFGVYSLVTVNGGSAMIKGGINGDGSRRRAAFSNIKGTTKQESDDGNIWTDISGNQSTKGFVKVESPVTVAVTGVTLDYTNVQVMCEGAVKLSADVHPEDATDKKVKWSVVGTNADAVKLYSDEACSEGKEVGAEATETRIVYAKGVSAGTATVKVESNADSTKSASCNVTVIQTYPLWVGDTQVTSANKDDVLGAADGDDATVKYTPAEGSTPATLTLNGATISGGSSESKSAAIYAIGELTINVTGDNTVTGPVNQTGDSYGILVDDNGQSSVNVSLNITGSGTLTSTCGSNSKSSYGIRTWNIQSGVGDITIGAETTVKAVGQGSSYSNGINSRGKVNVNGSLTATGVDAGVYAYYGSVNVSENAKLTATGNKAIDGTVKNAVAGTGWTDTAGTEGKALIPASTEGQTLTHKKAQFPAKTVDVTFKVANGSWDDETIEDKTVTLFGPANEDLKLTKDQIPAVGSKPNDTYKAGSWDVTPSTDTAITAATTYTYTYAKKEAAVVTKAPEAKALTYTGSAQELMTAGEATGGTMQYALGTDDKTAPTSGWDTSIPTATNAGT